MININLPQKFEEKLKPVQELHGIVLSTAAEFGEFLTDNKLYFFEEYTDHGAKHIESILNSTSNLITEETFNDILSGKDIGCFILSTILHDIAMHITLEGFNQLLSGEFDDVRIKEMDKLTWAQLWNDYLNEARKFSGKQLISIFGDQDTIIRKPPLSNKGEINGNDKKLIGEFIRRHHPRLAHEIALKGFPGKDKPLEFAKGLDARHKELIGLIARSHGLDLRICVNYIESEYGIKTRTYINEVHVAFLMILLRLADYLQIDKTRTSATLLKVKSFSSPFSEFEHKAHLAIDYIDSEYQNDPERIFVHVSPQESKMYLKIRNLIRDIQHEFDVSWAVLGELYGSIEHKPKIRFRRISSNLQEEDFLNKQKYVADKLYFKSNDDIAKLLIAPLYGNQPRYGVRELLQNAIDACREREIIEIAAGSNYKGTIDVNIFEAPNGDKYFEIRDNGVGMSIEVIKDYFLTAGASYRKSFDWQKTFIDAKGNSSVTRSGRFGVGVLAAFLIGRSIYMETKNIKSNIGYKFSADLNESQINILKDEALQTGTVIKIKIDEENIDSFAPKKSYYNADGPQYNWINWYALSNPIVNYCYFGKRITSTIKPGPDPNDPPAEWRSLDAKGYNKIFWTYDKSYDGRNFICNGIIIPGFRKSKEYVPIDSFGFPKISIIDNNGLLPLSLSRDDLSDQVSFHNELNEALCKDFLAYVLLFNPRCQANKTTIKLGSQNFRYPGTHGTELDRFLVAKDGFLINTKYSLDKFDASRVIKIVSSDLHARHNGIELDIQKALLIYEIDRELPVYKYISEFDSVIFDISKQRRENIATRIFLKKEKHDFLFTNEKKRVPLWLRKEVKVEHEMHNITCLKLGSPAKSIITENFLNVYNDGVIIIRESETSAIDVRQQFIDTFIEKYLGENVMIPNSLEERKALYPIAFEELEYYMLKHQGPLKSNKIHAL